MDCEAILDEVTKTLATLLKNEWSLNASPVKKAKISFRRGEPFDLTTRFIKKKISIEITKFLVRADKRGLGNAMIRELVSVNVWLVIKPKNENARDAIKDRCQQIEEEIADIIKTNQTALTGIRFKKVGNTRYMPRYEEEPPTLEAMIMVNCQYER